MIYLRGRAFGIGKTSRGKIRHATKQILTKSRISVIMVEKMVNLHNEKVAETLRDKVNEGS